MAGDYGKRVPVASGFSTVRFYYDFADTDPVKPGLGGEHDRRKPSANVNLSVRFSAKMAGSGWSGLTHPLSPNRLKIEGVGKGSNVARSTSKVPSGILLRANCAEITAFAAMAVAPMMLKHVRRRAISNQLDIGSA